MARKMITKDLDESHIVYKGGHTKNCFEAKTLEPEAEFLGLCKSNSVDRASVEIQRVTAATKGKWEAPTSSMNCDTGTFESQQ